MIKKKFILTLILASLSFCGVFLSVADRTYAALTPEQQITADQANNNAASIPGFQGVNTGNSTDGNNVLNNDTRLHSYPTAAPTALPQPAPTPKKFNYTLLESFPGFFQGGTEMTDLPALILAIYKFGIWTVGIAGLFMLVIGGFMYMASAGNTSTAGSARKIIGDALLGIVAALGAYLILYVINPDLTKITIGSSFVAVDVTAPIGMGGSGGKCEPVTKAGSPGTVAQLGVFGANATKASSICKIESGGDPNLVSGVDICQDDKSFSIGLFQINMIDSAPSICNASGDIFTTGTSKGSCVNPVGWISTAKSGGVCKRWSCAVKDLAKYDACVAKLKDPVVNVNLAKQISNGGSSWGRWGANRTCGF